MPTTVSSSASVSYVSTVNGQTTGQAFRQERQSTPRGTQVRTTTQNLGEEPVVQTEYYDSRGRAIAGGPGANMADRRIEDVSGQGAETETERQYRERMEDEYAKREGGA
jgi:hypothetical protein